MSDAHERQLYVNVSRYIDRLCGCARKGLSLEERSNLLRYISSTGNLIKKHVENGALTQKHGEELDEMRHEALSFLFHTK